MSKPITVYAYKNCGTCRAALKWLAAKGIEYEEKAIRQTPPKAAELKRVLKAYDGELKRLFNTSGQDYRAMGIKDKLPEMSTDEAITLLTENGNLVKRPLVVNAPSADPQVNLVGFKEEEWEAALA